MKPPPLSAAKFDALLKRLGRTHKPDPLPHSLAIAQAPPAADPSDAPAAAIAAGPDPLDILVLGFLEWDAPRQSAATAYERIRSFVVDHTELRVSHPAEIAALLGPRYPRAAERAARLHDALQEVFIREHATSLAAVVAGGKREARHYVHSLPGITPYVADLVSLLCFGGARVPVDEVLLIALREEGRIASDQAHTHDVAVAIEKRLKPERAAHAHALLNAWLKSLPVRKPATTESPAPTKPGSTKPTTKPHPPTPTPTVKPVAPMPVAAKPAKPAKPTVASASKPSSKPIGNPAARPVPSKPSSPPRTAPPSKPAAADKPKSPPHHKGSKPGKPTKPSKTSKPNPPAVPVVPTTRKSKKPAAKSP